MGEIAILGLGFSVIILLQILAPQILTGSNPLLIAIVTACIIAVGSMYLAHGINKNTSIALLSTIATLAVACIASVAFVSVTKLFGLGTDEAFYLQSGYADLASLKGLLLSGIIIGTLGVLDDVTTSQVAAVSELRNTDPSLTPAALYTKGLRIGREHITSLINTLALAYAGASLPLFLLFLANTQPLWVTLNSEFVSEEIVRTVTGSISLILAVPIATALAANLLNKDLTFTKLNKWRKTPQNN